MAQSVLYMSMSLDGFITGPGDDAEHGLGVGGERLHAWLHDTTSEEGPVDFRPTGVNGQVYDEVMATGAVVVGRRDLRLRGPLERRPPRRPDLRPHAGHAARAACGWVHYVPDGVDSAMARGQGGRRRRGRARARRRPRAVAAAGRASSTSSRSSLIPVLLGEGRRLFDHLGADHIELERVRVLEGQGGVTHLRYRVAS